MFGKYEDLILIILIITQIATIGLIIILLVFVNTLKIEDNVLKSKNRRLEKENNVFRVAIPKIFVIIESHSASIILFKEQMDQVHRWLGEVLNISNLIRSEEGEEGVDSSIIIEELRYRVKWAQEKDSWQVDDSDYYKGD